MSKKHIKLYYLRWYFPYNIGDTILLSSLFKALKEYYSCSLEVISDETIHELFHNDPHVDSFRGPTWFEKNLPKRFYKKNPLPWPLSHGETRAYVIWPVHRRETFDYLGKGGHLQDCIDAPAKNMLTYNYALQISKDLVSYDDFRPRIYLTDDEKAGAARSISAHSIGINIAGIRSSQKRIDGEKHRYKLESWRTFVREVKKFDPELTIYEIGQDRFENIGDKFIPNSTLRSAAAALDRMKLVVLSDGGVHNICNAIDKDVLLFQGYEWIPPDLLKMGNAIFNESYHLECRKQCHLFSDILKIPLAKESCGMECYDLDPYALAGDCIKFLKENG